MLKGSFRAGRPYVRSRLVIPRLGIDGEVSLIVDTGADRTIVQAQDACDLHVDFTRLAGSVRLQGIGGVVVNAVEPVILSFEEDARIFVYRLELVIGRPRQGPRLPSVLGRDVLNGWHMTYRPTENRLEFDVVSADDSIELA